MFYHLSKFANDFNKLVQGSVYRGKPNASEKIKLHSSIKHVDNNLGLEFIWNYKEDYANIYVFDITGKYLNKLSVINLDDKEDVRELNRMLSHNKKHEEYNIDSQIWHMWYVNAWKTLKMYLNKEIMYPLNIQKYIFNK